MKPAVVKPSDKLTSIADYLSPEATELILHELALSLVAAINIVCLCLVVSAIS